MDYSLTAIRYLATTMYAVLLLLGAGCASALAPSAEYYAPEHTERHFEEFITKFDKKYAGDSEKDARFQIFKNNLEDVNRLNENSEHTVFGITRFMDLTSEEFRDQYTGLGRGLQDDNLYCDTVKLNDDIKDANAPEAFDWRDHNAVTRVKDQGSCRSCWAFSASGHIEGQYARKYGKLLELSEQQHADCDSFPNEGCQGGYMSVAFKNLKELGGPMKEVDYPYVSGNDGTIHKCKNDKSKIVAKAVDCVTYNLTSQEKVKQLLFKVGPLPIVIKSNGLQYYYGGILKDKHCDSGDLDHAVLLVGYGKENGVPYWIVKNSWGTKKFGEDGYFRMEREENRNGACGMLNDLMATLDLE